MSKAYADSLEAQAHEADARGLHERADELREEAEFWRAQALNEGDGDG